MRLEVLPGGWDEPPPGDPATTWTAPHAPTPTRPARPARGADRVAERELREEIRGELSRLLSDRQLIAPRSDDAERIRTLIHDRVEAYRRRATARNAPGLDDPDAVERRLFDGLLRLGALQPLMDAPEVEEILVNGATRVFTIRGGSKRLEPDVYFDDEEELLQLVKRLIGPLGKRLDESSPMVDARLPDGSRLNAAIPPATVGGCSVSIRKFVLRAHSLDQLVRLGTLPDDAAQFLAAAVQGGVNVLVSGPTGAGKTTFVNALGAAITSPEERVVTIEEVAELQLRHQLRDCIALQARAGNLEGVGEIRIRELVRNALRMRPTRIVVGEVRGAEALDMLLAMNTGHEGSLTTIHGSTPRDALDRLATLAMMAEERLSGEALTRMVARTIELVVQLRFEPMAGRRRLATIFEVTGTEGDVLTGNDLWSLDAASGRLRWTGIPPRCLTKIAARGIAYAPPPAPAHLEARDARGERGEREHRVA